MANPVLLPASIRSPLLLALFLSLALPIHSLSSNDICRNNSCSTCATIPVSGSSCSSFADIAQPLKDNRFLSFRSSQCRIYCSDFARVQDQYSTFRISSNCTFCQTQFAHDNYAHYDVDDEIKNPHYCVPRAVCISRCGPERPGCIYTGSCGSQICFKGADSDKPAIRKRVTYAGPGTILLVDNTPGSANGTLVSTSAKGPSTMPKVITSAQDYCASRGVFFLMSISLCFRYPMGDRLSSFSDVQCRSVCNGFSRQQYEVVRRETKCNFCNDPKSNKYFKNDGQSARICIPRSKCVDECGAEPDGCVYTGSCRSLICFSGIDSKKAAILVLKNDTGFRSTISVDNDGDPIALDPPVLVTVLPTPSPSPSIGATTTSTPFVTPSPAPSIPRPHHSIINAKRTTIWAWLGPVLAFSVLLIVGVAVVIIYLTGRRDKEAAAAEPSVEI